MRDRDAPSLGRSVDLMMTSFNANVEWMRLGGESKHLGRRRWVQWIYRTYLERVEEVGNNEKEFGACEAFSGAHSLPDGERNKLVDFPQLSVFVQEALRFELLGFGEDLFIEEHRGDLRDDIGALSEFVSVQFHGARGPVYDVHRQKVAKPLHFIDCCRRIR